MHLEVVGNFLSMTIILTTYFSLFSSVHFRSQEPEKERKKGGGNVLCRRRIQLTPWQIFPDWNTAERGKGATNSFSARHFSSRTQVWAKCSQ